MMGTKNGIGLDQVKTVEIAEKLNALLADFSIFYMNLRGFHWIIRGDKFFVLHEKFEEFYDDLAEKIDEIAERILMIGHTPVHAYSDYLKLAQLKEVKNETEGRSCVEHSLTGFQHLIALERELLDVAGESGDEGSAALMSDFIREQEKTVWMLQAWLG